MAIGSLLLLNQVVTGDEKTHKSAQTDGQRITGLGDGFTRPPLQQQRYKVEEEGGGGGRGGGVGGKKGGPIFDGQGAPHSMVGG